MARDHEPLKVFAIERRLTSVDGKRDTVDCGAGRDTAIADSRDRPSL
jgi:hypothetical protein